MAPLCRDPKSCRVPTDGDKILCFTSDNSLLFLEVTLTAKWPTIKD